jgi:hypothetical protein
MIRSFSPAPFNKLSKCFLSLFFIIFILKTPHAATYEGTIGIYHVWMDIDIEAQNGEIQGSYFYQKDGINLRLNGKKTGDSISLSGYDQFGNVNGRFLGVRKEKGINGEWINQDSQNKLAVALKESDPKKMKELQQNTLLDEKDQEMLDSEFPEDQCNIPAITYNYKDKYIRSLTLSSKYTCGEYPRLVTMHKTYNAQTGEKIIFWDEIDSSRIDMFKSWLQKETQKKFNDLRSNFSEVEWINIFRQYPPQSSDPDVDFYGNPKESLIKVFTIRDASEIMDGFYIGSDGKVRLGCCNYFGFPDNALYMDFCDDVIISPAVLKSFVKKNSVLMKLAK